jgi:hypothetical protein
MAKWDGLRKRPAPVEDRLTVSWQDLEEITGGLPTSAYDHPAYWKGKRSGWPGFSTNDVRVGHSVTFIRRSSNPRPRSSQQTPSSDAAASRKATTPLADVVLVACARQKGKEPAPAKDLYTSSLFSKARAYAEASGAMWFVLSAQHGLVSPDEVLEPYDRYLPHESHEYRAEWGARVHDQLRAAVDDLTGLTVEIHAGTAYVEAIADHLREAGASIALPLRGLRMGERLAWYGGEASPLSPLPERPVDPLLTSEIIQALSCGEDAVRPDEFLASGGAGLRAPGLYSWWADDVGAQALSAGLGHEVRPGLIYAGLAGATRSRSGRKSKNTLWGRIGSMHLGGRHEFSTFRLSLGSILAEAKVAPAIDEAELTSWMRAHLRVIAVSVEDADTLDGLETAVLTALDPPLNLSKMERTETRRRLTDLRRTYGARV